MLKCLLVAVRETQQRMDSLHKEMIAEMKAHCEEMKAMMEATVKACLEPVRTRIKTGLEEMKATAQHSTTKGYHAPSYCPTRLMFPMFCTETLKKQHTERLSGQLRTHSGKST
jgi:hypothetical protein